ncbi:MAG: recombinase family protein, partial [Chloroflexota bacterium]
MTLIESRYPCQPASLTPNCFSGSFALILIIFFQEYSTGKYSYADLAKLLNKHSYKSSSGRLFSKEAIRGILRNK